MSTIPVRFQSHGRPRQVVYPLMLSRSTICTERPPPSPAACVQCQLMFLHQSSLVPPPADPGKSRSRGVRFCGEKPYLSRSPSGAAAPDGRPVDSDGQEPETIAVRAVASAFIESVETSLRRTSPLPTGKAMADIVSSMTPAEVMDAVEAVRLRIAHPRHALLCQGERKRRDKQHGDRPQEPEWQRWAVVV